MNWQHLRTFLWLRWRMSVNQWRRGGKLNAVLTTIFAIAVVAMAIPSAISCFFIGTYVFPKASPVHLLYAWDVIVIGFTLFWVIGLIAELQRTESLSLSKFLHLPVSVNAAFLINYLSSLLSLSLLIFVPILLGLGFALAVVKGAGLLVVLPLSAAFLFMVSALTYQFQGWLASLMGNPRRRRTVIVVMTAVFVLVFQLPNLVVQSRVWKATGVDHSNKLMEEMAKLQRGFEAHEFDAAEHVRRQQVAMDEYKRAREQDSQRRSESAAKMAKLANMILPLGWLPLGVMTATEGNYVPALLGLCGMVLIGGTSLWRAYRTTVRIYRGQFTARRTIKPPVTVAVAAVPVKPSRNFLETRLPGVSEPASAIALGGLQSVVRSAEGKLMLVTPLLMAVLFGFSILRWPNGIPLGARPLIGMGAMLISMIGMTQIMANQFGFDRDGFRVFVLAPVQRQQILLGKNLAFAPLALGLAALLVVVLQFVCPMRWDHFVSMVPQFISMFLLFCILANLVSLYAPMPIAAGSMRPANVKLVPILLQMFMFLVLFPLIQLPTFLPVAIEAALQWLGIVTGMPVCLALALLQCVVVIFFYRYCLKWQGELLESREKKILETVTNRA